MSGRPTLSVAKRSYRSLLWILHMRDADERRMVSDDGDRLLEAAHQRGAAALTVTWLALIQDLVASGLNHDVKQAMRSVLRAPGFTLAVSLMLGLGVAATTTLFAFVDTVLLRPLPYTAPERLVAVWETNPTLNRTHEGGSPGNILDWVERNDGFDAITASMTVSATLRGTDGGVPVKGVHVTRGFFDVFQRTPLLGRTFADSEFEGATSITSRQPSSGEPIVVLSSRLWQSLGANPQVVGTSVQFEGRAWRVIGVMPPDFAVPDSTAAFWAPWDMRTSYRPDRFPQGLPRDARFLHVVGRLKADVSIEAAQSRMASIATGIEAEHPATNSGWGVSLVPLSDELVGTTRMQILVVFAAMFCLLMLVCANVASLAIARGMARGREMAIRLALGAGGGRITRQLLAESAFAAVLTFGIAIMLASWSISAAVQLAPANIPRLQEVHLDGRLISFALLLALLVTAVGNAIPTFRAGRGPIGPALKDGAPVSARASSRLRGILVSAEIAAAVMLLVGSGLLIRSFAELRRVDNGFESRHLLVMRITPDAARYRTGAQTTDYYRRVLEGIRQVPGVQTAGAVTVLPMSSVGSEFTRPYWQENAPPQNGDAPHAAVRMATPGYFKTLGRAVISGREFADGDNADGPRVVLINETLARATWANDDPVGRNLILDYQRGAYPYTVVGVVRDARYDGPRSQPPPEIFIPHAQNPYLVMNVIARTSVDPASVAQTAVAYARKVDPDQPLHSVTTMDQLIGETMQEDRFATLLLTLFAIAGIVTAASGIYALLAYTVSQRRREIALRIAIGATPKAVARLIVSQAVVLAAAGGVVGLTAAFAGGRVARTLLFGVAPEDPVTLLLAMTLLMAVVVGASWMPARRAGLIDPARAMRD